MSSQSSRCSVRICAALIAVMSSAVLARTAAADKKSLLRLDVATGSAPKVVRSAPSASPVLIKNYGSHSEVVIKTQNQSPAFTVQRLKNPNRLVVDIDGAHLSTQSTPKIVGSPFISAVRLGAHEAKTRVVIDLKGPGEFTDRATAQGESIVVKVMPSAPASVHVAGATTSADRAAPAPQMLQAAANAPLAAVKRSVLALDEDVVASGSSSAAKTLASLEEAQSQPAPIEKSKKIEEKIVVPASAVAAREQKPVIIPAVQPKVVEDPIKAQSIKIQSAPVSKGAPAVLQNTATNAPAVRQPHATQEYAEPVVAHVQQALEKTTKDVVHEEVKAELKVAPRLDNLIQNISLEGQGKQPSIVVGLQKETEFSMDRTAPSEYVLKLRNVGAEDKVFKQTLFASNESSSIRSVRAAVDGENVLVRIFTQPSSYLTARRAGDRVIVQETQDLAQIARDIRAQIAPSATQDPKMKPAVSTGSSPQVTRGPEAVTVDPTKPEAAKVDPTKVQPNPITPMKAVPTVSTTTSVTRPADSKPLDPKADAQKDPADPKTKNSGAAAVVTPAATATPAPAKDKESRLTASQRAEKELAAIKGDSVAYTGRLISLDLQDADIDSALRIIAEVSNLNIVAGEGVVGKVTLKLVDVPWDQALDVILKNAGLDKVLEGNVLRVAPVDKLKAERESFKQAKVAEEELEPLGVKYMRISYAKASEIKALVETVLSERGSVAFDERSNQLVVKDVQKGLQNVVELIRKVDLRTPQILLETQIVEASRNLSRQLGSELGLQYIQSPATGNGTGLNFPSAIAIGGSADITNPNSILGSAFPIATSAASGSAITMLFDSADGTKNLQLRLSQLEQEGQVRIVSKPAVATTNNKAAEIKSVEKYRVKLPNGGLSIASGSGAQSTGAGNVATQTIEAGIVLNVTPQASPDYYILLDIHAKSSSFGSEKVDGIPNEIERSASSSVLVSSGQTFALGGIYKITETDSVSGVPFFKDIPVLGTFFRNSTTSNKDEELLFFITPRIVEGSFEDASMKVVS